MSSMASSTIPCSS